jgi:hypothetical protein
MKGFTSSSKQRTHPGITRKQVRSMILAQAEKKILTGHLSTALSTGGSMVYMSSMAQDDTIQGRTGDVVRPVRLDLRYFVSDTSTNATRIIIARDYLANAAIASVTDLLSTANQNSAYNGVNVLNKRFKIIVDKVLFTSTAGEQTINYVKSFNMKGEIRFVGTGATSASAGVGSLVALVICQAGTPTIDMSYSLHYTDI